MSEAVASCVHCGLCLPACPTYNLLGQEMDTPRGRIFLMKAALEDELSVSDMLPYVDRCLGCVACVTACPSGVEYGKLVNSFRSHARTRARRSIVDKLTHLMVHSTLPYPSRFRIAAQAGQLTKPLIRLLPDKLAAMVSLIPDTLPEAVEALPEVYPAQGHRRARVGLLTGCVQQVLAPRITRATLRVLAHNGVEVVVPRDQGCCGALAIHAGDTGRARALARNNLRVFPTDLDAILTTAAGCGSGVDEYELVFKGEPEEAQAVAFAHLSKDVSAFLDTLGIQNPSGFHTPLALAYHDACHLAHAQGVRGAPRRLLKCIPNLSLIEIAESDTCCGSAGTYNIEQPEIAYQLGERKSRNVLATNAAGVITGNIGCSIQIHRHLESLGEPLPVYHTLEVMDMAYFGDKLTK